MLLLQACGQFTRLFLVDKRALTVQLDLFNVLVVALKSITFYLASVVFLGRGCVLPHEGQVRLCLIFGLLLRVGDVKSLDSIDFALITVILLVF